MKKMLVPKLFLNKYIVSAVAVYKCGHCGEEMLESKEYEIVRKKIEDMEAKSKIPAIASIMAKVKYLVL